MFLSQPTNNTILNMLSSLLLIDFHHFLGITIINEQSLKRKCKFTLLVPCSVPISAVVSGFKLASMCVHFPGLLCRKIEKIYVTLVPPDQSEQTVIHIQHQSTLTCSVTQIMTTKIILHHPHLIVLPMFNLVQFNSPCHLVR